MEAYPSVLLENRHFRLTVGGDAIVESLICKDTGEELAASGQNIALCSVTQNRPFHNEVKLAHPNKRTTYQANRIRLEEDRLIVGFEIIPYEAVVRFVITDAYIAFTLDDFLVPYEKYGGLNMTLPPVEEFRILQLPIQNRTHFGEWLNVSWDASCAVNVLATSPYAAIDSERRVDSRILYADALREVRLRGTGAALIVSPTDIYLDCVDLLEKDFGLPRGVESRRSPFINASIYWASNVTPENVDEHIAYAKKGGFRLMLFYYTCFFKERGGYGLCGDYDYRDEYPNGAADVEKLLRHIRDNGITPGLHFLQTHIGMESRYVTPEADYRLHLKTHFTLTKPLGTEDTDEVFVMENPEGAEMADRARILKFGTELISYTGYTTEFPYRFTGCRRGDHGTTVKAHPAGEIGGVLDVSEFGATSAYLDQHSDLQDEVAEKIARAFDTGFRFVYFDGSEGTNAPFGFHVPNAQYRVYKRLADPPLFCEGAAKAHFSWHFLSGGNAFDVFAPEIFKEKIAEFPAEEAPRMREDFTRLNFGWWAFWDKRTQADMYEYGTSRAAAWDCPVTIQTNIPAFRSHPRTGDILEVMRRWEDVRAKGWLTDEHKEMLRDLATEHTLLVNEEGEYELVPYHQIETGCHLRAFVFSRHGESWAVYWHTEGSGSLILPCTDALFEVRDELYQSPVAPMVEKEHFVLPLSNRRYIRTNLPMETLITMLQKGEIRE